MNAPRIHLAQLVEVMPDATGPHPRPFSQREKGKTRMPRILIADDQPDVLTALRLLLKGESYDISPASSPAAVLKTIEKQELDLVLIDLNYTRDTTSGSEGLELLS